VWCPYLTSRSFNGRLHSFYCDGHTSGNTMATTLQHCNSSERCNTLQHTATQRTHARTNLRTHTRTHAHTRTHTSDGLILRFSRVHAFKAYTHTHTFTHTHTYTHTHLGAIFCNSAGNFPKKHTRTQTHTHTRKHKLTQAHTRD